MITIIIKTPKIFLYKRPHEAARTSRKKIFGVEGPVKKFKRQKQKQNP